MRIAADGPGHIEEPEPPAPPPPPPKPERSAAGPAPSDGVDSGAPDATDALFDSGAPGGGGPKYTQAQADKDAKALYDATEGGLTGWGTDEDAIFRTLEGKSAAEVDLIRKSYKDHYGKDMDKVLRDETSGDDRAHVDALLKGDRAETDAVRIAAEMDGVFGDEEEVLKTLEKAAPGERHAIAAAYAQKNGAPAGSKPEDFLLGRIQNDDNFSAEEKQRAKDLLAVGSASTPAEARKLEADAAAARIKVAVDGAGTDEGTLREMLGGRTKQQIDDMARSYQDKYGHDLRQRLVDETGGAERDEILALYDHGKDGATGAAAARDAARLKQAVDGMGTDEGSIRDILGGKSKREIDDVARAYRDEYGHDLRQRLVDETDGAERDEILSLYDRGKDGGAGVALERDAARMKRALDGAGTDEEAVRDILKDKSKADVDALARSYRARYGDDLRARLDEELDGREQVELLDQMYDRGKIDPDAPGANAERLRRLRESQNTEQGFGSWLTGQIQQGIKGESDEQRLDHNVARAEAAASSGDDARAGQLLGYAEGDLDSMQKAKDSAAEAAATGAAVVASTAVVIGTAGTATPLVVTVGAAALAGGAASATAYGVVQGDAADPADIARQGAIGAATGATAVVGAPASAVGRTAAAAGAREAAVVAGERVAVEAGEQVVAGSVRRAVADGIKQGAKAGAAGGAADGAVRSATESETWEDGVAAGVLKVVGETATGAATGAVLGGATGAGLGGGLQAIENRAVARAEARQIAENIGRRIEADPGRFELQYSEREIRDIAARGRELGLSNQQVEDMVFVGSRVNKRIGSQELMQQMENYATEVLPRGFPYRFESAEQYAAFRTELRDGLERLGISVDDVRVQGSALRKPTAGDVDIAVMVDDAKFDQLLVGAFSPPNSKLIRRADTGEAIDLAQATPDELRDLVRQFAADRGRPEAERVFNSRAQTFLHALEARKMREQEAGVRELEKELAARYGKVDISVMSRGGGFDVEPYMKVD